MQCLKNHSLVMAETSHLNPRLGSIPAVFFIISQSINQSIKQVSNRSSGDSEWINSGRRLSPSPAKIIIPSSKISKMWSTLQTQIEKYHLGHDAPVMSRNTCNFHLHFTVHTLPLTSKEHIFPCSNFSTVR